MIKAKNNFIFIVRDETQTEIGGFIIPGVGQEKPHRGTIVSVGNLVKDKTIKKGQTCLFHKGNGFEIEHSGITYLVIEGERIIAED